MTTTPATNVTLSRIGQIALTVRNVDRATAFYRDALGMRFLFAAPPGLAFFDCEGVRLMLSAPESAGAAEKASSSVIYFPVADIHAAHSALQQRGVSFVQEPHMIARMPDHELWMAFFEDGEGNTLALMSEVR